MKLLLAILTLCVITAAQVPSAPRLANVYLAPNLTGNENCSGTTDATCFTGNQTDGFAQLPIAGIYTGLDGTPSSGTSITASTAAALTSALSSVVCGQTIIIPSTATISGSNFLLAAKNCDAGHWITIRTDQINNSLFPAEHVRATPCAINQATTGNYPTYLCPTSATLMPTLIANSTNQAFFKPVAGANFYRLIGLNVSKAPGITNGTALIDLSQGIDHFILDRSLVHGVPLNCTRTGTNPYTCNVNDELKVGIKVTNATNVAIIDSWVWDNYCTISCTDSQAIAGGTGGPGGPYKFVNSLLSSAGEDVLFGGGGATAIPTDGEFRNNHFFKPASFLLATAGGGQHPIIKNNFELKNFHRALFEGNIFENSWTSNWQTDQDGYQLLLTPKNQSSPGPGGNMTCDSLGNCIATSGSFPQNLVAQGCAIAFHCRLKVTPSTASAVRANTWIDATHITVQSPFPLAGSYAFVPFGPGLCPICSTRNVTVRYNEFRNSKNGIQFGVLTSDGGDQSQGMDSASIHDNLFTINSDLSNQPGHGAQSACLFISSTQSNTFVNSFNYEHNTCVAAPAGAFSFSGLDVSLDGTNSTTDGSSGGYLHDRIIRNNIGPAGGQTLYKAGTIYPGGQLKGLNQQSCTPAVTGTTCTWTYTKNLLGLGQWTSQTNNAPFPSTNQTCNAGNTLTCFPSGSAFTGLFTAYNGPDGEPGYRGNYQLAIGNAYPLAGTDAKDLGISNWATFIAKTGGGFSSPTNLTPAAITNPATLPAATLGVAYSYCLTGTAASDAQRWKVISGALPPGFALSAAGCITGTSSTPGISTFTAQLMDAVQQYDSKNLTLTVGNVGNALQITSPTPLPAGAVGVNYSRCLTGTGGSLPYGWIVKAGSLPPGESLDPQTGCITGVPTAPSTYGFTIGLQDAAVFHLDDDDSLTGWNTCFIGGCGGGTPGGTGTPSSTTLALTSSPSLDGGSLHFGFTTAQVFTNLLWYRRYGANNTAEHFTWDKWFYYPSPLPNQMEFDLFRFDAVQSVIFMFGSQCNRTSGFWEIWRQDTVSWVGTTLSCTGLTANTWHHIIAGNHIGAGNTQVYDYISVDGVLTNWALTEPSGPITPGFNSNLGIQAQMDLANPGTVDGYMDKSVFIVQDSSGQSTSKVFTQVVN